MDNKIKNEKKKLKKQKGKRLRKIGSCNREAEQNTRAVMGIKQRSSASSRVVQIGKLFNTAGSLAAFYSSPSRAMQLLDANVTRNALRQ